MLRKKERKRNAPKKEVLPSKKDCTPCHSCGRLMNDADFAVFEWVQCTECLDWFHDTCDDVGNALGTYKQGTAGKGSCKRKK